MESEESHWIGACSLLHSRTASLEFPSLAQNVWRLIWVLQPEVKMQAYRIKEHSGELRENLKII
jgi:hypothetical protein